MGLGEAVFLLTRGSDVDMNFIFGVKECAKEGQQGNKHEDYT